MKPAGPFPAKRSTASVSLYPVMTITGTSALIERISS
jgi:hypothetical protein